MAYNEIDDVDPEEVSDYTYDGGDVVKHKGTGETLLIMRRLPLNRAEDRGFEEKYLVRRPNMEKTTVYNVEIEKASREATQQSS